MKKICKFKWLAISALLLFVLASCDTAYKTEVTGLWNTSIDENGQKIMIQLDLREDGTFSRTDKIDVDKIVVEVTGNYSTTILKQEQEKDKKKVDGIYMLSFTPTSDNLEIVDKYKKDYAYKITAGGYKLELFQLDESSEGVKSFIPVYNLDSAKR